jgi:hypothetical protein
VPQRRCSQSTAVCRQDSKQALRSSALALDTPTMATNAKATTAKRMARDISTPFSLAT